MFEIKEVLSRRDHMNFIKFPWKVYQNDPNWVPPLIFDMKNTFNKNKNPFFEFGEAAFFLALREGKTIGRVSAHINSLHNEFHKTKEGFFGFYECLEDEEASQALMRAAEEWLRGRGMEKIIGPENFTIYDEIGFQVDGFDEDPPTPVIMTTYNPLYYLDQMAKAGYQKEIDWLAFKVDETVSIKDTYFKISERIKRKEGLVFRPIDIKNIKSEVAKIKRIVHGAWAENWGHFPYSDGQFDKVAEALKLIVDPRTAFIVEKAGEAIAVAVTLPDINPSIQKMNGRLFPFGWWYFLMAKKKAVGLRTFLFGVLKEYRNRGIDLVLVMDTILNAKKAGYRWSECSIVVENNHKMIDPILKWGGRLYKKYRLFGKKL
ncbi:MAG: hypothetical protein JXB26_03795 [Candidatus Aminicenantes bacterium]|nr:hypothetical protein [Candidatus Aminicenantes bacterium]